MGVLALAIVVAVLPGILLLESPRLACATAKEVTADPRHPDNQLTVSKGSLIKVTLPKDAWPLFAFPDVSSSNSGVLVADQTPCGGPPSTEAVTFDFKAVAEGSAQLQTLGPNPGGALSPFAPTPQVWDVTVGPDNSFPLLVVIDVAVTALAGAFIFYRRRQGLVVRHATDHAG